MSAVVVAMAVVVSVATIVGPMVTSPNAPANSAAAANSASGCVFLDISGLCKSTNPQVALDWSNGADTTECVLTWNVNWGDGSPAQTIAIPGQSQAGNYLLASHTFGSSVTKTFVIHISESSSGGCSSTAGTAVFTLLVLPGSASCSSSQSCDATQSAPATVTAPGLSVKVTGKPSAPTGTATLSVASGSLPCPNLKKTVAPVATLTDTGFAPTDTLSVTATLPLASSTSAEQVCFNSTVAFKSQSNPTVKEAGTAFLLDCTQVANVAPCVTSSKQVGSNVVVVFIVPGGDPRFYIVLPKGRQLWLSHFAAGKPGTAFAAQLQSSGGLAPISWTIASGKLPAGCKLDGKTGAITGKPTAKGAFPVVVQATDSERPPQTAKIGVPISVT